MFLAVIEGFVFNLGQQKLPWLAAGLTNRGREITEFIEGKRSGITLTGEWP